MNEGSKQIFWLDDMQLRQFGWNTSVGECNSNQRTFAGQAFTIMFWYKQSTFSNGHNGIITIRKGTQGNTNGFSIGVETSGEFTGCQQNVAIISTGHTISANEWHHLAWTRDATGTSIKAYIDGELVHSGTYRAQPGFADTIVFPCVVNNAGSCAKLQVNGIEFSADEISADMRHPAIIYQAETMKALYTEVKDGVLIDKCGTYSINVNDAVVDMGKFSI